MHYLAAGLTFVAAILYGDRSGYLFVTGQSRQPWPVITRFSILCVLLSVAGSFLELALTGAPFEVRHMAVTSALAGVVVGHIGMRVTQAPPT